ncbi:hypothetical protein ABEW05_000907 [Botrytis cinerea]
MEGDRKDSEERLWGEAGYRECPQKYPTGDNHGWRMEDGG